MFNRFLNVFGYLGYLGRLLALAACVGLVGTGVVLAQAEPTMNQIYEAAQAGKLDQAQVMVQQVLIAHPNSAKAHFVQAELFARQGLASRGREALLAADRLAPGLPFAKPDAVQALRTQLASSSNPGSNKENTNKNFAINTPTTATSSVSPAIIFLVVAAMIAVVVWLIRRKPASAAAVPAVYASPSGGLTGPQTFGSGMAAGSMAPGYPQPGQPGYGQPAYGQPAGSGLGGRVMGGLATGLAVGAGVMAAQAIGKNLMGHDEHSTRLSDDTVGRSNEPLTGNNDMGGQNFGVNDASSWDDAGGSADMGGGGDWDS